MIDYLKTKEKLESVLTSIGLHKNEIIIYLDLISVNSSSALEISKRTKIHRSNVYDSLRKLVEIGFVRELLEERKHLYAATEPEKIKYYISEKEKEFDLIKDDLKEMTKQNPNVETFTISEGRFAAREALMDSLKLNSTIYVSGVSSKAVEGFGEGFLEEFHNKRVKKKIIMKHVYNKEASVRAEHLNKMKYTDARCLPDKYGGVALTLVCSDVVIIFIFKENIRIIKIKDFDIADTYKNNFELLYRLSKL